MTTYWVQYQIAITVDPSSANEIPSVPLNFMGLNLAQSPGAITLVDDPILSNHDEVPFENFFSYAAQDLGVSSLPDGSIYRVIVHSSIGNFFTVGSRPDPTPLLGPSSISGPLPIPPGATPFQPITYATYAWEQITVPGSPPPPPVLFTTGADTVDFNALTPEQQAAIAAGAETNDGLGGSDVVTLPSSSAYTFTTSSRVGDIYTVNGGDGSYNIALGAGSDTVNINGNGNSTITAGSGSDTITITGNGNNTVDTGSGAETITLSGTGSDTVTGGAGNDQISLTGGTDTVDITGGGSSTIDAGLGTDTITITGAGDDTIDGGDGSYNIALGAGSDTVNITGNGSSTITGGSGNDTITITGNGNNTIDEGAGNETITVGGTGQYTLNGGGFTNFAPLNINGGTETINGNLSANGLTVGAQAQVTINGFAKVAGPLGTSATANLSGSVVIGSGATFEVSNVVGTGNIAFGPGVLGTLKIDGTAMPANVISGFTPGDTIDLAGVPFDPNSWFVLETTNALDIFSGMKKYVLQLDQNQAISGSFSIMNDGHGFTKIVENNAPTKGSSQVGLTASYSDAQSSPIGLNQNADPYSKVVYLEIDDSNNTTQKGTGFIIGPHSILSVRPGSWRVG
jgi:Ca2+-binding RTX toxin-like protein